MRLADDLVEVFQPHLVLDQKDEVVVFLFQHLAVSAEAGVDLAAVGDLLFLQVIQHHAEDPPQCPRILTGTVRFVGGQLEMLVDRSLLVVVQPRIHGLRHGQGIEVGRLKYDAAPLGRRPQEADIKRMGVVRH